jgi:hypothetical protein
MAGTAGGSAAYLVLAATLLLSLSGNTATAQFRLFDNLEDETLGPVDGQDGWDSAGGGNEVAVDPANPVNQVLYVPSSSSTLHKSLLDENVGVLNGTARMMFCRLRVAEKQTFSAGLSPMSNPREYSDFAPEIGMANSAQNLDLRAWDDDDGNYEVLTQLEPDRWYNVWILVDAYLDQYEVWINHVPGAPATAADKLSAADGDETFAFRAGQSADLTTFYVKTSGGSSGQNFGPVYFDDIYLETTAQLNLTNPTARIPDFDDDGDIDLDDYAFFADCLYGPGTVPDGEICPDDVRWLADMDMDGDVDLHDGAGFFRSFTGADDPG